MSPLAELTRGSGELGLDLDHAALQKLIAYIELLQKWNRTYNLTAIRDPLKMVTHHLLDSLAILAHLPSGRLADVGSGGGLPGIPIAIAEPARPVTLNDSNAKKVAFLREAAIQLGLRNVTVHAGRAESWQPAERFSVVVTRGFSDLAQFIGSCRHLLAPGGILAAMKGVFPVAELSGVPAAAGCGEVLRLRVPLLEAERHLVLCRPTE